MSTSPVETLDTEELRGLVAGVLDLDTSAVTDSADFVKDLNVDSLMALEVMVALEKKYKIALDEDELKNISSFGQVRDLVTAKLAES
ncbi:MAG: acyl carrier protein [Mycobacteriales bacterium]